jgi:hypothetical protein
MYRFLIVLLLFTGLSCKKAADQKSGGGLVEIYALETFSLISQKCQVDPSMAVLQANPVISNNEIISYSPTDYLFKLTAQGKQDSEIFESFPGFAVTVNKEVIYYGIHKPFTSSSSCDHSITMYISFPSRNLVMNLGYPGPLPGITIDDQRNNAKLIDALNAQGKLTF